MISKSEPSRWLFWMIVILCQFSHDIALKCFCDVCITSNDTCETDGFCFTSTSLEKGVVKYSYRCLHRKMMFPVENPILCLSTMTRNDTVVIQCCKEHMCNKDLKLQLHVRIEDVWTRTRHFHREGILFGVESNYMSHGVQSSAAKIWTTVIINPNQTYPLKVGVSGVCDVLTFNGGASL